jgi:hypothetical protein
MSGRMDGVTLSMTRAVLDAQEVQVSSQRATQLVELQQRESLRIEAEHQLRETRAMWGAARSRPSATGRPVEAIERREHGRPGRDAFAPRRGTRRDADAPADVIASPTSLVAHPSLGTRLDLRT